MRENEYFELDGKEIFMVLLHKWWLILLAGLLGALLCGLFSKFVLQPVYTSTTKVYVITHDDGTKMTLSDLQTGTQLTKDYMVLVKSTPVLNQVISQLNLQMTAEELAKMIEVRTPQDTRILEIIVKNPVAETAKALADSIAKVSSEHMVNVMEMKKVNIVEEGNFPERPSGPNVGKLTILGGIGGLLLLSVIIIVAYIFNDTIKSTEDIEKYLGLTALGTIPLVEISEEKKRRHKIKKSDNKIAVAELGSI